MKNKQSSSKIFYKKLTNKIKAGFKITEYNTKLPYVVLTKENKKINHSLHLKLFLLSLGTWSLVWIFLTLKYTPKKEILIAIDEDGNVFEEKCLLN